MIRKCRRLRSHTYVCSSALFLHWVGYALRFTWVQIERIEWWLWWLWWWTDAALGCPCCACSNNSSLTTNHVSWSSDFLCIAEMPQSSRTADSIHCAVRRTSCCNCVTSYSKLCRVRSVISISRMHVILLSRRSRQRERLSASVLSICSSVCLSVCRENAKKRDFLKKTKKFRATVSVDDL